MKGTKSIALVSMFILLTVILIYASCRSFLFKADKTFDVTTIKEVDGLLQINDYVFVNSEDTYNTNCTLVVSGNHGVLIDAGYKESGIEHLKNYISKNAIDIDAVIITHDHYDHIGNIDIFKTDNTKVYNTKDLKDNQIIKLKDKTLKIIHTPGHNDNNHFSVVLADSNILVAGDVVSTSELPPITSAEWLEQYKSTLKTLRKSNYSLLIPGHGQPDIANPYIDRSIEYIDKAEKLIRDIVKDGGGFKDISAIKLEQCIKDVDGLDIEGLKAQNMNNLTKIYLWIKQNKE